MRALQNRHARRTIIGHHSCAIRHCRQWIGDSVCYGTARWGEMGPDVARTRCSGHDWTRLVASFTVTISAILAAAAPVTQASQPRLTLPQTSPPVSFGPAPVTSVLEHQPLAKELAVFTNEGMTQQAALRALRLQDEVAETDLAKRVSAALGSSYAGVWLDPPAAKFHIGVTSGASRRAAQLVATLAGLAGSVVETRVRFTWVELIQAQNRWNKLIARLLAHGEAKTGLNPARNALIVTLSSSVPLAERFELEREASDAHVNVSIVVLAAPQPKMKDDTKNCSSPFVAEDAFCENTLVSGVTILVDGGVCTAGPMLIEGIETYMLTAGHCFGKDSPAGGEPIKEDVTSQYTEGPELEIGKEGTWIKNNERDTAEVKVSCAAKNFTASLPDPVPALMAEWVKSPKTPHVVEGVTDASVGQAICHEGAASGEHCGKVTELNVTTTSGTEHLVDTNACSLAGDSGGPYFFRTEAGDIMMLGTLVSGDECTSPVSDFEPLEDLELAPGYGISATFKKKVLTTANEARVPLLKGLEGELAKKAYTSKSGAMTLETVGGSDVSCEADTDKGTASTERTGTFTINFTECTGFGKKCRTPPIKEEIGEIVLSGKYTIVFIDGTKTEVGIVFEFSPATIECGTICPKMTQETLKLRGSAVGVVTPVNEVVTPSKVFSLVFSQAKGKQIPEEYENENGEKVKAELEIEGSGSKSFGYEQSGLSNTDELLFQEAAEIYAP